MAKKRRIARQVYVEHLLKIEQEREQHLIKRRSRGKRQRSPEPEEENTAPKVQAEHDDETDAPRITKRHRSEKPPVASEPKASPVKSDK